MKFSINDKLLLTALNNAVKFVVKNNLSSVLQSVLIEAIGDNVIISATDYQRQYSTKLDAAVELEGVACVPAKQLFNIVKAINGVGAISVTVDKRFSVQAGRAKYELAIMDANMFPKPTAITPTFKASVPSTVLIGLLNKIVKTVSKDMTKIEYNGCHIEFTDNNGISVTGADYQIVGTDLADAVLQDVFIGEEHTLPIILNVPKKTIEDLVVVLPVGSMVDIVASGREIIFSSQEETIRSKLIEKSIRGVTRLFNSEYSVRAIINKEQLIGVVKRMGSLTSELTNGIEFVFQNSELTILGLETESGKGTESMLISEYNSKGEFKIIMNAKHVLMVLNSITSEEVIFAMNNPNSPMLILPTSGEEKFLLVPISIERLV